MKRIVFYFSLVLWVPVASAAAEATAASTTTTTTSTSSDSLSLVKLVEGVCVLPKFNCELSQKKPSVSQPMFDYCQNYFDASRDEAKKHFSKDCEKAAKAKANAEQEMQSQAMYRASLVVLIRNNVKVKLNL